MVLPFGKKTCRIEMKINDNEIEDPSKKNYNNDSNN